MKKIISVFMLLCLVAFSMVVHFNSTKSINFTVVKAGLFDFPTQTNMIMLQNVPKEDIVILHTQEEWTKFSNMYLNDFKIQDNDFKHNKLLFLQVKWSEPMAGATYEIKDISVLHKNLTVTFHNKSHLFVSADSGVFFRYGIICTVDKKYISDDTIPHLVISEDSQNIIS